MATATPVQEIQEETKCPICLEYLTDPVTINCGHNFCRACITRHCDTWTAGDYDPLSCPNCRTRIKKGALQNNYQLANIVEKIKHLDVKQGTVNLCGQHDKGLDLFCEEDWKAVCVVCWRSPEHRSHTVLLMEEAAQKYKEQIQSYLKSLKRERKKIQGFKLTAEERSQEYLKQTETERQKIVSEFQQMQHFLREKEQLLLAHLEKLEEEIMEIKNENVTKFSAEISRLSELINEMERKSQKPEREFLQDVRSTLSRCVKGKFQHPEEISPELEEKLSDFSQRTLTLMETLRTFKVTLPSALNTKGGESLGAHRQDEFAVSVTLDPDTAHPDLVLSEDGKSVRWKLTPQDLPDNPERFDTERCVLGCEGFTSGRHCWEVEVEVGDGCYWAVGVARASVQRKGGFSYNPEEGIWAMGWMRNQFWALTSPLTPQPRSRVPSRILVCVDCEWGLVTFLDASDNAPIFTFWPGSVPGERIRPWLWVGQGSQLRLCP